MEYKIFHTVREKIKIPYLIRLILGIILLLLGFFLGWIPILPGFILVIVGMILIIPGNKVKDVIKTRRNVTYMITNLHSFKMIKHKFFDTWGSLKRIFKDKIKKRKSKN